MSSTLTERSIKAVRKAHTCDWCGEPIEVGQSASYSAGFNDEEKVFWTSYMHPECHRAWWGFHTREDIARDDWDYRGMMRGSPATADELMAERYALQVQGEGEADGQ